ncbi:MAG TPA: TonB-dependent receptor plug domain-containing protein [Opitutaceae bacterium]|nr:TonB-dependent receptor plug domain-containing protein [Opitutaceae bacterium]
MNPLPLVRFQFKLLAALAAVLWSFSSIVDAVAANAGQEDPRDFDIAAGVAPGTLKQFSAQAGGHLLYSSEVVEGVKTNRVKGRLRPRDALERLVAGSGLAVSVDGSTGALSLVRAIAGSESGSSPRAGASPTGSESTAFGTVQGRVLKVETGDYVERARVTVAGTRLEGFTDNAGFYRLDRVPVGRMEVQFLVAGYGVRTEVVDVVAGSVVQRDVQISSGREDSPIVLEKFTVGTSREMEAPVIALNERRFAPNLLNVLSTDEFGAIPDGSVGEFLKFVPGINIDYTGGVANTISIDGVPPSNVPVTFAGFNLASTASGDPSVRQNELLQVSINNISRVEVVLSPTPESPGSALAGSVNFVPRSAFERVRPQFNFNTYVMMRDDERSFSKTPGPRRDSTLKLQPGFDLSYLYPVNDRFGFTVSAGYSNQYTSEDRMTAQWRGVSVATNPTAGLPDTTASNPYLTRYGFHDRVKFNGRTSGSITVDYRLSDRDRVSFALAYASFTSEWTFNEMAFQINRVNDAAYSLNSVRSQVGQGELIINQEARDRSGFTYTPTLVYRHDGPLWKAEAGAAVSTSKNKFEDITQGVFRTSQYRRTNVTVGFDDIFYLRPTAIAINDGTTGAAVNPYALDSYTAATGNGGEAAKTMDSQRSAYGNLRRQFFIADVPLTIKVGFDLRQQIRDTNGGTTPYSYVGADGRASTVPSASDDGAGIFLDESLSQRYGPYGFTTVQWPSGDKLWSLYQSQPSYFTTNENTAYRNRVTESRYAEETISSVYLRGDLALMRNRLRLTGGLRVEQTNVEAQGPLTDPTRNFQRDASGRIVPRRDANGNIVLGTDGQPLPALVVPTTNALGVSQLTYLSRGYRAEKEYLRYFPSINGTFSLKEDLLFRASHYYSIGRPNFGQYSGGLTLPDIESAPSATNRISVNNAGIKPWSARTTRVRLEYYFQKGTSHVSVGAFRRDFENFFGSTVFPATPEFLALYNVDPATYLGYDVATNFNLAEGVRSQGIDFEFNYLMEFLPKALGKVQVRGNVSSLRNLGPTAANFANFVPRTYNLILYMKQPRYSLRAGWNYTAQRRGAEVTGRGIEPGTFNWIAARLYLDLEGQFQLNKSLSLFANFRNIKDAPQDQETFGPNTPERAQLRLRSEFGSLWTFGLKGTF